MLKSISEYITYLMIKNKILNIELYDIYVYSIQVVLLNLGILIVCFMISVLTGDICNLIAFIIFFIHVRKLAGGYHCRKARNCFIISIIVYVIPIILIKWGLKFRLVIEFFSLVSFFLLSKDLLNSIDNKKINEYQIERNKILLNKIINFEFIIYVILLKINLEIALQGAVFINIVVITILIEKIMIVSNSRL